MDSKQSWQQIVASAVDWKQAHAGFDAAVEDLPPALRGRRPPGAPHSVWELVEHIRIAQRDLLDFMVADEYEERSWPADYWPTEAAPPSERAWEESLSAIRRDREALKELTTERDRDLTARIPRGTGQTYLRTVLVAIDHASYHTGQIVLVRRLLDAWPEG